MSEPERIHVYPRRDIARHTLVETCWCAPTIKREIGGFIIVHNALDPALNDEAIPRPSS